MSGMVECGVGISDCGMSCPMVPDTIPWVSQGLIKLNLIKLKSVVDIRA